MPVQTILRWRREFEDTTNHFIPIPSLPLQIDGAREACDSDNVPFRDEFGEFAYRLGTSFDDDEVVATVRPQCLVLCIQK